MRQAGMMAAPGIVALKTMVDRLTDDHSNAELLAKGLEEVGGLSIENTVETNIVLVNTEGIGMSADEFLDILKEMDILAVSFGPNTVRFVTHFDVSEDEIRQVLAKLKYRFS